MGETGNSISMLRLASGPLLSLFYEPLLYKGHKEKQKSRLAVTNTSSDGRAIPWLRTRRYF